MRQRRGKILQNADGWFRVREVEPGIWLLAEPGHVNSWLVVGDTQAALIDSGMGVRPIRPVVEAITNLPVLVVNTHSHFDHIGGNHEFEQILIHPDGVSLVAKDVPRGLLEEYVQYAEEMEQALPSYLEADRRFFFSLAPADEPRPFAIRSEDNNWRIPGTRASGVLSDGYVVDLGGRTLQVIATPGHSPDHVALLLKPDGVLFAGDAVSTGAVYVQWPESNLETFARSAERLAALSKDIHVVLVHHWLRYAAMPSFLSDVAEGTQELILGRANFRTNRDCSGAKVREAVFDEFSIYLPVTESPSEKVVQ
ncbi:MAG TPA: MBL fold metallo-hydrolase [Candidatus Nanopelagicaceae bacterium]|nr:MBL fold metallo-hydrolase [Candidatus Nanopelagicaceae bacterium]